MNKVYDYEILSILNLILEDYERDNSADDLAYNLKGLLEVIENNEIVEESASDSL